MISCRDGMMEKSVFVNTAKLTELSKLFESKKSFYFVPVLRDITYTMDCKIEIILAFFCTGVSRKD